VKLLLLDDGRVLASYLESVPTGRFTVNAAVLRCGAAETPSGDH
jgi:hypothetical protein